MKLRGMVSRKVARVARRLDRRMGEDIEVLNVRGKEFVVTDGHRQAKVSPAARHAPPFAHGEAAQGSSWVGAQPRAKASESTR